MPDRPETNVVLIGMPAVGKSTVGVLLAKATGRNFIDTDVWIQSRTQRSLQDILDAEGMLSFCRTEERTIRELGVRGHVIATGGSVPYSTPAMAHLRDGGVIVHLDLPLAEIERRLTNLATRGVVLPRGFTLADLYAERHPLYRTWADVTIDCAGKSQDRIVTELVGRLDA